MQTRFAGTTWDPVLCSDPGLQRPSRETAWADRFCGCAYSEGFGL